MMYPELPLELWTTIAPEWKEIAPDEPIASEEEVQTTVPLTETTGDAASSGFLVVFAVVSMLLALCFAGLTLGAIRVAQNSALLNQDITTQSGFLSK